MKNWKERSKPYARIIMWWFDFLMIVVAYIGIVVQLAGKNNDGLIIALFIWLLLYLFAKILFFNPNSDN